MKITNISVIPLLIVVAACSIPIKNATVTRALDGTVTQMTGVIQGSLAGDSPVSMAEIGSGVTCSGATNSSGVGSMTCSDGKVIPLNVPSDQYGKLSGAYVGTLPDGTVYASGWGAGADLVKLAAMLPN